MQRKNETKQKQRTEGRHSAIEVDSEACAPWLASYVSCYCVLVLIADASTGAAAATIALQSVAG